MSLFKRRVTVETQLDALSACGIKLESGITVEDVILGGGLYFFNNPPNMKKLRRNIEIDPYNTIILCLGGEAQKGDGSVPLANQLFHWDPECVDHPLAYAEIVSRLERMSGGALGLTRIRGDVDLEDRKFAFVEFERDGQTIRWNLAVDTDWMTHDVFTRYNDFMRNSKSNLRLYCSVLGQSWIFAMLPADRFQGFAEFSHIEFEPYD